MLRIYSFNSMSNKQGPRRMGVKGVEVEIEGSRVDKANQHRTLPVTGHTKDYFKNYDRFILSSSASLGVSPYDDYSRPFSDLSMSTCSCCSSYSSINRSNSFILGNNDSPRHVSMHTSGSSTINRQTSCVGSLINNANGSSQNVSSNNGLRRRFDPKNVQKIVLEWCQNRTKNYTNVKITNFSSSWADGLAFCALIHSFLPDSFDYGQLSGQNRKQNFELAFNIAQKWANVEPLLEVNDMLTMGNRPDEKCIYTYLSTIYSRFNSVKSNANSSSSVNTSNPNRQPAAN